MSRVDITAEELTTLRFFAGESPDAIEWLLDACSRRRLEPGECAGEMSVLDSTHTSAWVIASAPTEIGRAHV